MNIVFVEVLADKNDMAMMNYHPHPGLAYMAACLEKRGHFVRIVDPVSSGNNLKKMICQIVEFKPHIVGFSALTASRFRTIDAINALNDQIDAFIVAGGPHFQPTALDAMSKIHAIDCIVKGEGEETIVEIANALEGHRPLSEVSGIFFREGDIIKETPDRPVNYDLDSLPFPAYHLCDLKRYKKSLSGKIRIPALSVISSRGCPCKCIFCSITALKKHNFRKRSPELFLDEVVHFHQKFGYVAFQFNDDTITMDRSHITAICNGILKRKLRIIWSALARVNTVDEDLLILMKAAGCVYLAYGIESGSEAVLKTIKKGITIGQAMKAVEITSQVGIQFEALFMASFPQETMDDVRASINLINRISAYPGSRTPYGFTLIYPGTEIEKMAYEQGVLPKNFSWNTKYLKPVYSVLGTDPFTPCWETPLLNLEVVKAMFFRTRPLTYKIQHILEKAAKFEPRDIMSGLRIGIRMFSNK